MITSKGNRLCIDEPMSVGRSDQVIGETGSMARQIEEMHLELHQMEINVTTQKQHNIFMKKDIYREVERPCDNPGVESTSMRRQALEKGDKTPEVVPTLPNRGTPLQRDSIGSITKGIQVETLNEDGKDETLVGEDKNLADTARRPGMRSPSCG